MARKHPNAPSFPCKYAGCTTTCARPSDLPRHYMVHTGERPFECETCGKAFRQESTLKTHLNTHTGAKPFRCTDLACGMAFADGSACARHIKERHVMRGAYRCPHERCEKRRPIKRKSEFKRHLLTSHKGVFATDSESLEEFFCGPRAEEDNGRVNKDYAAHLTIPGLPSYGSRPGSYADTDFQFVPVAQSYASSSSSADSASSGYSASPSPVSFDSFYEEHRYLTSLAHHQSQRGHGQYAFSLPTLPPQPVFPPRMPIPMPTDAQARALLDLTHDLPAFF
ncbi:hypothetical protein MIND_01314600 [Mycena indigotica]|uniref:C2H2-type domain-containing protein n=1 Tax=Mycena indigotica TaxID=2126181 RepID=A0A8H6VWG2_9AGAR|nr:uncharacterized protein MIND_01314600 [Mycena indigotica]KAF7290739.1 hypothetical protein MIND_01314600 [Mycena indigotica]